MLQIGGCPGGKREYLFPSGLLICEWLIIDGVNVHELDIISE